jgi:hypothetical protein
MSLQEYLSEINILNPKKDFSNDIGEKEKELAKLFQKLQSEKSSDKRISIENELLSIIKTI